MGSIGGAVQFLPQSYRAWELSVVVGLCAVLDSRVTPFRLPSWQRQVRRDSMFRWPLWATAVSYGVQLGGMVTTRITHISSYAVLAAAILSGHASTGAAICGVFGLARSLPAAIAGPTLHQPDDAFRFAANLGTHDATARRWAMWAMWMVSLFLAFSAFLGSQL